MNTSDFNSKVRQLENKIKTTEQKPNATISSVTAVLNKIPDVSGFVKKSDYATEISSIENDVTNAALKSQLNYLKSTHIADEVKKIDDKTKKDSTSNLNAKTSLEHNKSVIDDLKGEASSFRGSYYFNQQSYLIYEPKTFSCKQTSAGITHWKSTGIDNYSLNTDLRCVANISGDYPKVSKGNRMSVRFSGNCVKENKSIYPVKSVINIYIVYSLNPVSNARNTDFTAQNCLFGAVKITKDVNTSNYKYVGYGICFDESSNFSIGNITNGKNLTL